VSANGVTTNIYVLAACRIGILRREDVCLESGMSNFVPFNRDQSVLLRPDLKEWLPADDLAHFVVAAVDRVPLGQFAVPAASRDTIHA
jgi:hypothetical protein